MADSKKRDKLIYLVNLALSLALIVYLAQHTSLSAFWQKVSQAQWGPLCIAILLLNLRFLFAAIRWKTLLKSVQFNVKVAPLFMSYLAGMLIGFFVPSGVGCDAYRAAATRNLVPISTNLSVIFFERILGFVALGLFSIPSLFYAADSSPLTYYALLALSATLLPASVLFCLIRFIPLKKFAPKGALLAKILKKLSEIAHHTKNISKDIPALTKGTVFSLLFFLPAVIAPWFVAQSIGAEVPLSTIMVIMPVIWVISLLPITFQGIGLHEGVFVYLLTLLAIDKNTALAISFMWLGIRIIAIVVGGLSLLYPMAKPNGISK